MVLEELRETRQDTAEYWIDHQHKANKLEDVDLRVAGVKAEDIATVFSSLDPECWYSLQLAVRYASIPRESEDSAQTDQSGDLPPRCQDMNFCLSVFNTTAPYDDDTFQHVRQILFQTSAQTLPSF